MSWGVGDMSIGGVDAIYQLWDDLADFGPGRSREALIHCMSCVCALVGAQNAVWLGAVRMASGDYAAKDPLSGWRMGTIESCTRRSPIRVGPQRP
jgi:hypothetical protein